MRDQDVLVSLGLCPTYSGPDWTDLGQVVIEAEFVDEELGLRPATKIRVEVSALPAEFWRFTIERPDEDSGHVSHFAMETGSGSFQTFWPMAKAIAEHMVYVRELSPRDSLVRREIAEAQEAEADRVEDSDEYGGHDR